MENRTFDAIDSYRQWSRIPVDDIGYFTASELLSMSTQQREDLIRLTYSIRFNPNHWRNKGNAMVEFMGVDKSAGKTVMDFGCGMGMDGIAFGMAGASVIFADMHPATVLLAVQNAAWLGVIGRPAFSYVVEPFVVFPENVDLFWSFGVLHHTPLMPKILKHACDHLKDGGQCRIGVYSDRRWVSLMQEDFPENTPFLMDHPRFNEFVRKCDSVGSYAECYSESKFRRCVEDVVSVKECRYLSNDQILGVVIEKK